MSSLSWIPNTSAPSTTAFPHSHACDFVKKLYKLLEDQNVQHIVSWSSQGDRFVVKDVNEFTKSVLPRVYKHSNFASFVRQLNKYDFHKIKNVDDEDDLGEQNWIFHHPSFHFDGWGHLENIKRKTPATKKLVPDSKQMDGDSHNSSSRATFPKFSSSHSPACERQASPSYNPGSDSDLGSHHSPIHGQLSALQTQISTLQAQLASLAASNRTLSDQLRMVTETQTSLVTECTGLRRDLNALRQNPATTQSHSSITSRLKIDIPRQQDGRSLHMDDLTSNTISSGSSTPTVGDLGVQSQTTEELSQRGNLMTSSQTLHHYGTDIIHKNALASMTNTDVWPGLDSWMHKAESGDPSLDPTSSAVLAPRPPSSGSSLLLGISNALLERSITPTIPGWTVPPRVLLVDDDIVSRMLGSKFLQVCGCSIDVAVDGVGAVNKMNIEKYDLVLMDIMMPKLDGVSATSLIRKFDLLTPIISMTSNSTPGQIMSYYSSGMNDVLPKPVTKARLLEVLEKHLIHLKTMQQMSSIPIPVISAPSVSNNFIQIFGKRGWDESEDVQARKRPHFEVVE